MGQLYQKMPVINVEASYIWLQLQCCVFCPMCHYFLLDIGCI